MTTDHEASRTLVKSPPELWEECSDAASLARHFDGTYGEIRITRLEPETTVAWEGEHASGTVRIEPSGWGTKVTLTATTEAAEPPEPEPVAPEPEPVAPEPEPAPEPVAVEPEPHVPAPSPPAGLWARMWRRLGGQPLPAAPIATPPPPTVEPEPEPEPEPVAVEPEPPVPEPPAVAAGPEPRTVLNAVLDSLGQAHHRPFSRG